VLDLYIIINKDNNTVESLHIITLYYRDCTYHFISSTENTIDSYVSESGKKVIGYIKFNNFVR